MAGIISSGSPFNANSVKIIDRVSNEYSARPAFSGTRLVSLVPENSGACGIKDGRSIESTSLSSYKIETTDIPTGKLIEPAEAPRENASRKKIITGLDRVAGHDLQGIPKNLLGSLMKAVESRGAVLFTRPVEPICRTLIDEGWPTKHFRIKAKSSNWGAQAGTIPVNQKFSKLALDEVKVKKYNKLAQEALADSWPDGTRSAVSIPLIISQSRLEELEQKAYLYNRKEHVNQDGTRSIHFNSRICNRDDSPEYSQLLTQDADGGWRVYDADENPPSPIMVMAQPIKGPGEHSLPVTADIDPLMESFPLEERDLGGHDQLPVALVSDQIVKRQVNKYRKRLQQRFDQKRITKQQLDEGRKHYDELEKQLTDSFDVKQDLSGRKVSREDFDMGNVSQRTRDMVQHYDKALGRKYRVIHHNVDAHSPATDEKANYPITAFLPKSLDMADGICMIFNEEQLLLVLTNLMDQGYAIQKNPLWGKAWLNSTSFQDAKAQIGTNLNARMAQEEQFVAGLERKYSMSSDTEGDDIQVALAAEIDSFLDINHPARRDSAISMGSIDSLDSGLSSDNDSIANLSDFDDSDYETDNDDL